MTKPRKILRAVARFASLTPLAAACGSSDVSGVASTTKAPTASQSDGADEVTLSTFSVEIWADNWMAVYVDGQLIGEDSVPITTERSFNAENRVRLMHQADRSSW